MAASAGNAMTPTRPETTAGFTTTFLEHGCQKLGTGQHCQSQIHPPCPGRAFGFCVRRHRCDVAVMGHVLRVPRGTQLMTHHCRAPGVKFLLAAMHSKREGHVPAM